MLSEGPQCAAELEDSTGDSVLQSCLLSYLLCKVLPNRLLLENYFTIVLCFCCPLLRVPGTQALFMLGRHSLSELCAQTVGVLVSLLLSVCPDDR